MFYFLLKKKKKLGIVPMRRGNAEPKYVSEFGINRDWIRSSFVTVFAISRELFAACNGFDATSDHPHYLFLFPNYLSYLYLENKHVKFQPYKKTILALI